MINNGADNIYTQKAHLLLAIHSSTETLGVGTIDLRYPARSRKIQTFNLGRDLSNKLISCVEELIPNYLWRNIGRIAVSIGPGGFTSTRLSVVMARTLAQEIKCEVDGISSFALMAPRLFIELSINQRNKPFWIIKYLPRRGTIGGQYQIIEKEKNCLPKQVIELKLPTLVKPDLQLIPSIEARDNVHQDVIRLLDICKANKKSGILSPWENIIPIYPTSPVEEAK